MDSSSYDRIKGDMKDDDEARLKYEHYDCNDNAYNDAILQAESFVGVGLSTNLQYLGLRTHYLKSLLKTQIAVVHGKLILREDETGHQNSRGTPEAGMCEYWKMIRIPYEAVG